MKNMKRILNVKVIRECDTDPDTSYLGEYGNTAKTEYAIDRAHSKDCASLFPLSADAVHTLNHADEYINSLRIDSELDTLEDEELQTAMAAIQDLIAEYENPDCDCSRHFSGHEYRYFNGPVENYEGCTSEEICKYVRQDYERMEALNNQQWGYIGIRAVAEIALPQDHSYTVQTALGKRTERAYTCQTIHSGGLWGIESDSDKSYFTQVESEELLSLKSQLQALGFSTRAISAAFKNVEHVDR